MTPKIAYHPGEAGQVGARGLLIAALIITILVAIGIIIGVLGPGRTITCQRVSADSVDCTVTHALFDLVVLKEYTIAGVLAANLDENCNGSDCAYAMQIYGNNGFVQVDDDYVRDLTLRQQLADSINEFLQDPDSQSITLKDRLQPAVYVAAGVVLLALFGLLVYTLWGGKRAER